MFRVIWESHGKKVYYFISRNFGVSSADAEDLFQEVMMKVYQSLDSYNPAFMFSTWIYRIARNHVIDHLKRKRPETGSGRFPEPVSPADVENGVIAKELFSAVDACVGDLEPDDRQIAYLRFYENLSHRRIAGIMGMNVNTVKTRVLKIRSILRDRLRGYL